MGIVDCRGFGLTLIVAMLLGACGSNSDDSSADHWCSFLPSECAEYHGLSATTDPTLSDTQKLCPAQNHEGVSGTWSSGTCPTSNRLGGCRLAPYFAYWFYSSPMASLQTTADVMQFCAKNGYAFVP